MKKDLFLKKANYASNSLSDFLDDLKLFVEVNPYYRSFYLQLLSNWFNLYYFIHDLQNNVLKDSISYEVPAEICKDPSEKSDIVS